MPNLPMVSLETPINAGIETGRQPGMVQNGNVNRKEPLAFKKKLEDCIKIDDTPYGVPTAAVSQTGDVQDNSMAANLTDAQAKPQIVGILEGFGLLDYQSDLPHVSPHSSQSTDEQTVNEVVTKLLQGLTQDTEQTGALETYARMLSKDQLSKLPPEMQQAIAKAVGDYLGSFESTNNEPAQEALPQGAGVTPVNTQAAEAAADISALSDKIASLLIKLKAMEQDAKPADAAPQMAQMPGKETVSVAERPQAQAPVKTAAEEPVVKPETVAPAAVQTAAQPTENKPAGSHETNAAQPMKSEVKTAPVNEQTAQTQTPEVAANLQPASAVKTETSGVQQTAKPQETTGGDFVKDNVMRIVDKMSSQVNEGKVDFDVELKPDFLGKVNIKLSMQNGEIRMQIKTDDMGVKSMFADQVSSMQAVLKDKGITVANIDVTYQSQMQTGADQRSYSQNGSERKQSSRMRVSLEKIAETGVFETMSQITGYTHGSSSVEYLA